ncbi:MAG TPA: glutamate--cysteine ligase, partial [Ruania sp.]|nr:glutamate--cysteine ligase [Ruania sp.]
MALVGDEINTQTFSREQRLRYREKVRRCLDVFSEMLAHHHFDSLPALTGLEIELNLVDSAMQPSMKNAQVLSEIADPAFQTELARYNIELNVPPQPLPGEAVLDLERDLRAALNHADDRAMHHDAQIAMIGI